MEWYSMHLWMAWFPLSVCEIDPCCCTYGEFFPFPGCATFHFKNIPQCLHPHYYYYQQHHCQHHYEQHLGYFQFWAITSHSAKHIPVLISWDTWDPQVSRVHTQGWNHWDPDCVQVGDCFIFTLVYRLTFPSAAWEGSQGSPGTHQHLVLSDYLLPSCQSHAYVAVSHCGFHYPSVQINFSVSL